MNIFDKLFRKPVPPPDQQTQIKVQIVSSNTLTLDQWRKDSRLVASSKELERNETFRMMVAVLENSHVRFLALPTVGARTEDRAALQARIEGYQICLNNLEAMSQPWAISKPIMATFEPITKK